MRTDLSMLRGLGATCSHLSAARSVIGYLEKKIDERRAAGDARPESGAPVQADAAAAPNAPNGVDIVICDEQLCDGPVTTLLRGMAGHPALRSQPILVMTGSKESAKALRSAGVYVLQRPYASEQLRGMLQRAMSPMRRTLRIENFPPPAEKPRNSAPKKPQPITTSDLYEKGRELLKAGEHEKAGRFFEQVLKRREDHVEANLGLARVHSALGDAQAAQRCLIFAAASSMRAGEKERGAAIAALLPPEKRHNIHYQEAVLHMEEEDFRSAALSFLDAEMEDEEARLHSLVSRACQFTENPEDKMGRLCDALGSMGREVTAKKLRSRLLEYPAFEAAPRPVWPPRWMDKYPRLRDAVCVVSDTALAWKQL